MPEGNEIPPGGEGKLQVNLSSGSRRQQIRKIVVIQTNDPDHEAVRFEVKAEVRVELEVIPALLRFDTAQSDAVSVRIKNYSKSPVQLSELQSSTEYVTLSVSSMTIPPGSDVELTGMLSPDVPQGLLRGWATLRTNFKDVPLLQVRIWGQIP